MATNYANVNATWPDDAPTPTPQEALKGAKKLVKLALTLGPPGSKYKFNGTFKLTSGRRYTWPRRGVFYVNPNERDMFGGWKAMVHDISHWAGRRLFPGAKPHDARTAFIERTLAEHVVKSGWLEGKLKREPKAEAPVQEIRAKRITQRIKNWEAKKQRAERALKKLYRQQRYYDNRLAT